MVNDKGGEHCRYFQLGGLGIRLESELPINDRTFHSKIRAFESEAQGDVSFLIRHHFALPEISWKEMGKKIYDRAPWEIYSNKDGWHYLGLGRAPLAGLLRKWRRADLLCGIFLLARANPDHSVLDVYSRSAKPFMRGNLDSLTLFPTDQILFARGLVEKGGCYLHGAGIVLDGKGYAFVGPSEAGKSTIVSMVRERALVLCDDRIVVRKTGSGFTLYGTWSHGEVPLVSPMGGPLKAVLFLNQAGENRISTVHSGGDAITKLLPCVVRPLVTREWWEKVMALLGDLVHEVPAYDLHFDRTGNVLELLTRL